MCRRTSRAAGRLVQGDGPLFVRECAIASLPHRRGFVLGQVPRVDVEMHSILFAHHVVELVELYLFRGPCSFECCCRRERRCAAGSSVWIDRHRRATSGRDGPVVDPLPSDAVGSVDECSTWRSPVLHDHHDPGVEMSLGMIDVG